MIFRKKNINRLFLYPFILFVLYSCNTQKIIGEYTRTIDLKPKKSRNTSNLKLRMDGTFSFNYGISCINETNQTDGVFEIVSDSLIVLKSYANNTLPTKIKVIELDTNVTIVKFEINIDSTFNNELYTSVLINDFFINKIGTKDEIVLKGLVNKIKLKLDFSKRKYDYINYIFVTKDITLEKGNKYFITIDFNYELLNTNFFEEDTLRIKKDKLYFINDTRSFADFSYSKIDFSNRFKSIFRRRGR